MNLYKRLERLENATPQIVSYFHTLESHPLTALYYFGVEGGHEFHLQKGETESDFRQRCEQFAVKHSHKGFMTLFFQIEMEGCSFF